MLADSQSSQGTYGEGTLRPVTIKQILDAQQPHPDADFKIDEVEVSQVRTLPVTDASVSIPKLRGISCHEQITFIGQIRNISTQATNVTYKLDDGTGTIEVKQWIDADAPTSMDTSDGGATSKPKLVEDEWAHVWGRLKSFSNKRHVGAHVIRPIVDKMDIQYHLLEATYVHLYFTRGPLDQIKQERETNGGGDQHMQNGGYGGGGASNGDSTMLNGRPMPNIGMNARKIYQTLRDSPQNNEGLHVQNIAALCGLPVAEVLKAGDEMLNHSMIFTTVDDNTWALLEF